MKLLSLNIRGMGPKIMMLEEMLVKGDVIVAELRKKIRVRTFLHYTVRV